jgi:small subunit ribosomal protein S9
MTAKKSDVWRTIGRRKSSVARVIISNGKGQYTINKRNIENYFGRDVLKMVTKQPFELLGIEGKYNVDVNVKGGGLSGQAGAIRLGISRGIEKVNPDYRAILKENGFLTRDSREVERKKPGQPGARKKFQFSKR